MELVTGGPPGRAAAWPWSSSCRWSVGELFLSKLRALPSHHRGAWLPVRVHRIEEDLTKIRPSSSPCADGDPGLRPPHLALRRPNIRTALLSLPSWGGEEGRSEMSGKVSRTPKILAGDFGGLACCCLRAIDCEELQQASAELPSTVSFCGKEMGDGSERKPLGASPRFSSICYWQVDWWFWVSAGRNLLLCLSDCFSHCLV